MSERAGKAMRAAGAALVVALLLLPAGPALARTAKSHRAVDRVHLHVDSVSPSTPLPSTEPQELKVALTLTATQDYHDVQILAERGDPIGNMTLLNNTLQNPVPPSSGLPVAAIPAVEPFDLPAGTTTYEFTTTTSVGLADDKTGLCLCANAQDSWVYPLFFSAHAVIDGIDNRLGGTVTYVPVFYQQPAPVRVSWVWPLLERPHRLLSETVFTDDDLATSLSTGRLSRALAVVEQVGDHLPLTLVIDPELLDEVEVMATEPYTVEQPDGKPEPGTGQDAASAWLERLHTVLLDDPDVTVRLTPYADPDVETLTERELKWATSMPASMITRVSEALAGRPLDQSFSWPVTGAVGQPTLRRLYGQDVRTLLLNSSAVALNNPEGSVPAGIVNLEADRHSHQVAAALLTPAIQRSVVRAISTDGEGDAALPELMAELAIRAVQEPGIEHAVPIAAPRYVDPDVTAAVATIEETAESTFAEPIALEDAVQDSALLFPRPGRLASVPPAVIADAPPTIAAVANAAADLPTVRSLLDTQNDDAAAELIATLPAALQRAASSAWRSAVDPEAPTRFADQLTDAIKAIITGVHFVDLAGRTYTFASNPSALPITITNTLPYAVQVRIKLVPRNTTGLSYEDFGVVRLDADQTRTIKLTTTTERSGRIQVDVLLRTPSGDPLGEGVTLTVRSTALGIVGVIITIVAGVVLAIALLWRVYRRLRGGGGRGRPAAQRPVGAPEPVR